MLGLINDCCEQLVISKFGLEAWHAIKKSANCSVKDHGFEQHGHYPDSATVDIVVAASKALDVTVDDVLELFGQFFLQYTIDKGYDNLLRCQGSTLRLWLSNLNAMHDHLQSSMPAGHFPVFWCEDCMVQEGAIVLHYFSVRGPLLGCVVVGITKEVAKVYFDVEVNMDKIATQGEGGSEFSSWRISAVNPEHKRKLTMEPTNSVAGDDNLIVKETMIRRQRRATPQRSNRSKLQSGESFHSIPSAVCPFAQSLPKTSSKADRRKSSELSDVSPLDHESCMELLLQSKMLARNVSSEALQKLAGGMNMNDGSDSLREVEELREFARQAKITLERSASEEYPILENDQKQTKQITVADQKEKRITLDMKNQYQYGLTSSRVRSIFPYHVMVDDQFNIVQVGRALPEMLLRDDLVGLSVETVLKITKPILAGFDWPTLNRLADQKFFLTPLPFDDERTGARIEASDIKFKGNIINMSGGGAMFVLSPDADNIMELNRMGLTMSDLPLHSFQRDVVFLGEHIASEVRTAHKLDRLSKRLEREKNLSNTLLNSMLPASVAESMRAGKTVEPLLYENVTVFFSDVVGFTSICDVVEPWDVIDMLNQLYTVMDHLASHFNLYKVETIGDAYMCCSGMPAPEEDHAQKVSNFALAVAECVHLVKSPADGKPIELRIGIHTGSCMGGVVGTLTPHYCLFGDTVNTTARHESTGLPGKIHASSVLYECLAEYSAESAGPMYDFTPRGFVEMKGKARCYTYWLDRGSKYNEDACPEKIRELHKEVKVVLSKKKWLKRKYFGFSKARTSSFCLLDDATDTVYSMKSSGDASTTVSGGTATTAEPTQLDQGDIVSMAASTPDNSRSSDHDTLSYAELKRTSWLEIAWESSRSRIDMVAATHGLLSSMLWKCTAEVGKKLPENKEVLDHQLLCYVDQISTLYGRPAFHSWDHACQVVLSATFLIKEYHNGKDGDGGPIEKNPFVRFITVFAALIHDVKHLGVPNAQLEKDQHGLSTVYQNSYLERQSIQVGLGTFIEDFSELSTFVLRMCPEFLHLVTSAVLATDVSSRERQQKIQDRFERVVIVAEDDVSEFEKTQTVVEQILLTADVGHCSQGYNIFLNWNAAFFLECLDNYRRGRGADPRLGWYQDQIGFIEGYILPLMERCSALVPHCELTKGTRNILHMWKENGEEISKQLLDQSSRQEQDRSTKKANIESNGDTSTTKYDHKTIKTNGHRMKDAESKLEEGSSFDDFLKFLYDTPSKSTARMGY